MAQFGVRLANGNHATKGRGFVISKTC